jgi:hypothetical protein
MMATWLTEKELFDGSRAFRRLVQILAEAGRDAQVLDHSGAGLRHPCRLYRSPSPGDQGHLATGVRCAARTANWPLVACCVELAGFAQIFEFERCDSDLSAFADVPIALMGAQTLGTGSCTTSGPSCSPPGRSADMRRPRRGRRRGTLARVHDGARPPGGS